MVLKILKDCTDATGKEHRSGTVVNVAKCIARGLVGQGKAEVFVPSPVPKSGKRKE